MRHSPGHQGAPDTDSASGSRQGTTAQLGKLGRALRFRQEVVAQKTEFDGGTRDESTGVPGEGGSSGASERGSRRQVEVGSEWP